MVYLSFKKGKKRRFGTQFQHIMTNKKHGGAVFFCALSVGASAPNPDTRNFSGKVSWNFKSFCQNKVMCLREILLLTFLIRKVSYSSARDLLKASPPSIAWTRSTIRELYGTGTPYIFACSTTAPFIASISVLSPFLRS